MMGIMKKFTVELFPNTNPNGVYYTGETISGEVKLELKDEMKIKELRLHFTGTGSVKWTKVSKEKTEAFKACEKYVDETLVLYQKDSDEKGKNSVHPKGQFKYPFTVQIPANIPSSFRGKFGHVTYNLSATIKKPWKLNHKTPVVQLIIHRVVDLNRQIQSLTPPQAEATLTTNGWCCFSGNVTAVSSPAKAGYCPGEEILIHGQIENHSRKHLHSIKAKLTMEVTYYTKTANHKHSEVVCDTKLSPVPQPNKEFWSGHLKLQLPPSVSPFRLDNCNIIDLRYMLSFFVILKGGKKLQTQFEIAVGSIPLENSSGRNPDGDLHRETGVLPPTSWVGQRQMPAAFSSITPVPVFFYPMETVPRPHRAEVDSASPWPEQSSLMAAYKGDANISPQGLPNLSYPVHVPPTPSAPPPPPYTPFPS